MTQALGSIDIATGALLGFDPAPAPLPRTALAPRAALERAIRPALQRGPCMVSFSGGRDSSAVLAVATALARREGLALPIPVTNVFPASAEADEACWQESVVSHLGLPDWVRLEHGDELDVVGPYARRLLSAHGLLLPCNVHFHLPILDAAAGGSLLTGIGGDELFSAARAPRSLLVGRRRGLPRRLAARAGARAPRALRRAVKGRRLSYDFPWLTAPARRALAREVAAAAVHEPRRLWPRLAFWRSLRYVNAGCIGLDLAASQTDTLLVHPLLDHHVWAATGALAAPRGFSSRSDAMARLFGDLLPAPTISRPSKASFDEAMWTATARAFAHSWDGRGVPREWVDVDALRDHWHGERPCAQTFTLLQSAWLAGAVDRVQEGVDGVLV